MDLETFIAQSLTAVVAGVRKARKTRGSCFPERFNSTEEQVNRCVGYLGTKEAPTLVHLIEFDVAVTVSASDKVEGDAGIKVVGIGAEGSMSKEAAKSSVSRIKFAVPVMYH